jgi:hypothetical protein
MFYYGKIIKMISVLFWVFLDLSQHIITKHEREGTYQAILLAYQIQKRGHLKKAPASKEAGAFYH